GLTVAGPQVTDAGVAHLAGHRTLQNLRLNRTSLTDRGLPHLMKLPNLVHLQILGTRVTATGLQGLKGLPKLDILYVPRGTNTPETVAALHKALPKLRYVMSE